VVEHLSMRRRRPFNPALQLLEIILGWDSLARGVRHGDAANAEHGEHGIRSRLGSPATQPQ
jgi:hypothetical protein